MTEIEAWTRAAMSIIAPISEQKCTGTTTKKTCQELGITGRGACLRCQAKHFRENGVPAPAGGWKEPKEKGLGQGRGTRFCAENKVGSSSIDLVQIETNEGTFDIAYDTFKELFHLEVEPGDEVAFEVKASAIKETECEVPR